MYKNASTLICVVLVTHCTCFFVFVSFLGDVGWSCFRLWLVSNWYNIRYI